MTKKILHLRSSSALLGAENVLLALARHSQALGYEAIIGVLHDLRDPVPELYLQAEALGLKCHCFSANKRIDWQCITEIKTYIKENDIAILHTHGYREDIYAYLATNNVKKIATNHLWKRTNFMEKCYAVLDALALRSFHLTVGVSDNIVSDMQRYGLPKNRIKLIENGININEFTQVKSEELLESSRADMGVKNRTVITMISSLTIEKAHYVALEAFHQLITAQADRVDSESQTQPLPHLLIVGEGDQKEKIESFIDQHELHDYITLLGKRSDVSKLLAITDIFLMTSNNEGLPMALLEAMAAGKAVIATQVGGITKLLNEKNVQSAPGIGTPPGDSSEIFKALSKLHNDPALRQQLGVNAQEAIIKHYSAQKMTEQYCELYTNLMAAS